MCGVRLGFGPLGLAVQWAVVSPCCWGSSVSAQVSALRPGWPRRTGFRVVYWLQILGSFPLMCGFMVTLAWLICFKVGYTLIRNIRWVIPLQNIIENVLCTNVQN